MILVYYSILYIFFLKIFVSFRYFKGASTFRMIYEKSEPKKTRGPSLISSYGNNNNYYKYYNNNNYCYHNTITTITIIIIFIIILIIDKIKK